MKETVLYDQYGKITEDSEKAIRAEIITRSSAGSVISVEYYTAQPKSGKAPSPPNFEPSPIKE